jgi:hypothetical protein
MRFACRITKVTDTHSEYVIVIAFPLQQWLHERSSVLRYTYIVCIVTVLFRLISYVKGRRFILKYDYLLVCIGLSNYISLQVFYMRISPMSTIYGKYYW